MSLTRPNPAEISPHELMAVFVSRQIENEQYVAIAANMPVTTAGVILANLTHAPDLHISALSFFMSLLKVEQFQDLGQIASPRFARWAEAVWPLDALLDAVPRMDWSFTGAMQVDAFGNTNLIGVGPDHSNLAAVGPGSTGSSTVMAIVRGYIIYMSKHTPRQFVEKVDFRSAVGFGAGGDDRVRLGLRGGGPRFVLSPKAVMDFEPETRRMRLLHLLPGVSVDEVVANTGFELVLPPSVDVMQPPTAEEMDILRTRIDPEGVLR